MEEQEKYIWTKEEEELNKRKELAKKKRQEAQKKLAAKKRKIKKQKRRKLINRLIFVIILVLIINLITFLPFLKVNKINITGNIYFTNEQIQNQIQEFEKHNKISIFTYLTLAKKIKTNIYFEKVDVQYTWNKQQLNLTIDEILPVYHDTKDTYYINDDNKIQVEDKDFTTPLMIDENLTLDDKQKVAEQLAKLNKDILVQIKEITKDKTDKNVVIFQMYDGNLVYIQTKDIAQKMKYYNQMEEILESLNKDPGYIHLDIGDYYEPK
ncbi:MAG: cell division protein FtsQ/DivIB [Mycoplasmatales bacterium]